MKNNKEILRGLYWFHGFCVGIVIGIVFLIFTPNISHADSLDFTPNSPQVYDGTSDVFLEEDNGGDSSHVWFAFDINGINTGDCSLGTNYTDDFFDIMTNQTCSNISTFQEYATGIGTVHIIEVAFDGNTATDCYIAGSLTACQNTTGFLADYSYELTGTPPVPEVINNSTSTTEQSQQNIFNGLILFLISMTLVVIFFAI